MLQSIRSQILIPLVVVQGLTVVVLAATAATLAARRSEAQIIARLDAVIASLGHASFPYTPSVLARMHGLSGAHFAACRADGRVTEATLDGLDRLPAGRPEPESAGLRSLGHSARLALGGTTYLAAWVGPSAGPGRSALLVLYPETSWRQARWEAAAPPLAVGVVTLILLAIVAHWLAHRIGGRVRLLQAQVARIAGGDFQAADLGPPSDEIRALAGSINQMAAQLDAMQQAIRRTERTQLLAQVAAGLAHQLRNSLTGARMSIQLHARRSPPKAGDETLAVALRQLVITEEQVKGLLSLGRAEHRPRSPCRLDRLLAEIEMLVRPSCRHAGVALETHADLGESAVLADEAGLRGAILNLVLNAVEASGSGGSVILKATPGPEGATIEVLDDGPGPCPSLAARLFEPFVTSKPEGVGLGLALAQRVALDHGGTLAWDRVGNQTRFRLTLPALPTPPLPESHDEPHPDRR